ncbi:MULTISPECIES: class I adenylate-forming enzyme family protein [unclassified Sinorhizobium]|uniref:class I adenylate-forming enzyme family protein n=1 Tax=unclassified Sinorhizobium TaxID=2613772 RepID=UPI0024C2E8A2|nr:MULTISPECIES: class I adenylate-forming enzyme family protein [unclassified Sinorhizobium]MDK1375729.1 class I adenylate-forming enzyme family protein [Sinorhizobium sp. 6-70]MDK1482352.1 class I adenylate-forming enzyme family protein [Sinorhizobium sp. 6-117]
MPLAEAIMHHAGERPHEPAFRIEDRVFSFGELAVDAGHILHALGQRLSAETSDSVLSGRARLIALQTGNHPLFAAAFIAATAGGNCAALIDPHLPEPTRRRMIEQLRPDIVVHPEGDALRLERPATGENAPIDTDADGIGTILVGEGGEPFLIVFTSGTTGEPKAIVRDRRSWRLSLETGQGFFGIGAETTTYAPGPLAHGLTLYALVESLKAGAEFIGARHFDPRQAVATIIARKVKRLVLVPTMLRRLCEHVRGSALPSVEAITVAGAKLTPADRNAARIAFPEACVIEYYGASELGFITVAAVSDNHAPTAVGKAFPGVRLHILDEAEKRLPAGETGTIFVESPLISDGYVAGDDGTGFRRCSNLATVGDLGFLDPNGTLHLIGRAGGMVLSGGNNIYPSEVEAVIMAADNVSAVQVLGLDHPDLGSELAAIIQPRGEAFDHLALERHLAAALPRYKHPRKIWLCRELPMTASGKIAIKELRQWIAEGNGALERLV